MIKQPSFLKERLLYFWQHNFVRKVVTLQIGSLGGTLLQGLSSIIIARILQPELFGIYSISFSLAGLLVLLASLGIQDSSSALLSGAYAKGDHTEIRGVFSFISKMMVVVGILSIIVSIFAPYVAERFYHNSLIGWYAGILIIASFLSNTLLNLSILSYQVVGKIGRMSVLAFSDQLVRNGLVLALVAGGFGITGAMSGHLVGACLMFLISIIIWSKIQREHKLFPTLSELIKSIWSRGLKTHLNFGAWVALDKNIAALFGILPVLMIGLFVSSAEVTYFKISLAYINLVLGLMGPVSTLLNVELPRLHVSGLVNLRRNFIRISLYSLFVSMVLTAGAILVSPVALKILYGPNFLASTKYIVGLGIYGAFLGIGVGLGPMWRALNKVKVSIIINTVTLGIGIPAGLYLIRNHGVWGAIIMVSAWFTISHLASFFYIWFYMGRKDDLLQNA